MRYFFILVGVAAVTALGVQDFRRSKDAAEHEHKPVLMPDVTVGEPENIDFELAEKAETIQLGKVVFRNTTGDENQAALISQKQSEYQQNLKALATNQKRLAALWKDAPYSERPEIVSQARTAVFNALVSDIFPAWYGTMWDFNGVTQTPGEGKIACGYFVTTCLRDAGFNLERVKLAQQASQKIIKTVVDSFEADTKITYQKPIAEIASAIRKQGHGIYLVGLDTHTGFVVNDGNSLAFVHSSYYRPPFSVTAEPVEGVNPLADSKYRIVGKILGDQMIEKWLTGEKFEMK